MKQKFGILGSTVVAAGLLAAISLTVDAFAESKGQGQGMGMGMGQNRSADQSRDRDQDQLQTPIYGSQLMTERERQQHRTKMRTLKTEQEREAYRLEQHQRMQERARAKGVTLPDEPPKPLAAPSTAAPSN